MGKKVKKVVITTGIVSAILLGSLSGGMTSYAAGPGESKAVETTQVNVVTYNQDAVRGLGSWEQNGSTWKFKQKAGGYITSSWIESLSEQNAFYYVDATGVMSVSTTVDGKVIDANGIWRNQVAKQTNPTTAQQVETKVDANGLKVRDYSQYDEGLYDFNRAHPINPVNDWVTK
jgi:hypothetical protein